MSRIEELPLVSIITPVYNGAQFLEELILSVQSQDYPNIEHIIIDDGSQDDDATIAILKRYPHLRWWSRENRGQYATMNEGLRAAKGELVCFISADDLIAPGAVSCVVELMRQHPKCDGIAGLTQFIDEAGAPYPIDFPFQRAPLRYYAYFTHLAHCSLYLKREKILEHDLVFDPTLRYVGDYDWILRVLEGLDLYRANLYLSQVRIHEAQTTVRFKQSMTAEHRRVVKAFRLNPFLFSAFTTLYIIVHDLRKLHYAWTSKGITGVWGLFTRQFHRKFSN